MAPDRHDDDGTSNIDQTHQGNDSRRRSTASQSTAASILSNIPVADGFRPNPGTSDAISSPSTSTSQHDTSTFGRSHNEASSDRSPNMRNRPSSVAKPHRPHESLTLRHEHNSSNHASASFPRASIASSDGPVIRPDSPYRGPTGPSHPYQMYPQRTLSNATSETNTLPSRQTPFENQQQGPTHPYTLYTQSTAEIQEARTPPIPVGFNSAPDSYRRQLGPDGEEAGDLIGPMGHTEELPPYTRYPEIAYVRKGSSNDTDSISTPSSSTPRAPVVAAGAGGIGRATRDPEFSSTEEDLAIGRSRPSLRSQRSQASQHEINTAALEVTEKSGHQGKWQRRAKKKLWGIVPYWAICLVMVGMVVMGIIMGAVIGTVLKKSDAQARKAYSESEAQPRPPLGEVIPYEEVPDDLDPITVGIWGLDPLDKDESQRKCFNNSLEFNAWSCDIFASQLYSLNISERRNASKLERYDLELKPYDLENARLTWGTQPLNVPKPSPLKLVNDTFEMGRGPAWWLKVTYNKTVLVREDIFPLAERRLRRGFNYDDYSDDDFGRTRLGKAPSTAAEVGERPWNCTWPDTTLEIFIYPNVNINPGPSSDDGWSKTAPEYPYATPPDDSERWEGDPRRLDPYPKAVKFLERRLADDPGSPAICRQVIITGDGPPYEPALDDDDNPVEIVIVENDSNWEQEVNANKKRETVREWYGTTGHDNRLVRRDVQELTSCGCLWWAASSAP